MLLRILLVVTVSVFLSGTGSLHEKQNKVMPKCCARAHAAKMGALMAQQGPRPEERGGKAGFCGNKNTKQQDKAKVVENCPCHKPCDPRDGEDPKCGRYCDKDKCACKPDPCPITE